jgi:hypothetical protein
MTFSFDPMDPFWAAVFVGIGFVAVGGILLQVLAIVRQSKSLFGLMLKLLAIVGLLGAIAEVRDNALPYLIVFFVTSFSALACATLARRALLR